MLEWLVVNAGKHKSPIFYNKGLSYNASSQRWYQLKQKLWLCCYLLVTWLVTNGLAFVCPWRKTMLVYIPLLVISIQILHEYRLSYTLFSLWILLFYIILIQFSQLTLFFPVSWLKNFVFMIFKITINDKLNDC